jgi:hypothetical protein
MAMADLFKEAKRGKPLPRVTDGYVLTGERYADWSDEERAAHERGTMPPMLYTLDVSTRGTDSVGYGLRLTEEEMLRVTADWLSKLAVRRAREQADARKKALRDAVRT